MCRLAVDSGDNAKSRELDQVIEQRAVYSKILLEELAANPCSRYLRIVPQYADEESEEDIQGEFPLEDDLWEMTPDQVEPKMLINLWNRLHLPRIMLCSL